MAAFNPSVGHAIRVGFTILLKRRQPLPHQIYLPRQIYLEADKPDGREKRNKIKVVGRHIHHELSLFIVHTYVPLYLYLDRYESRYFPIAPLISDTPAVIT